MSKSKTRLVNHPGRYSIIIVVVIIIITYALDKKHEAGVQKCQDMLIII